LEELALVLSMKIPIIFMVVMLWLITP